MVKVGEDTEFCVVSAEFVGSFPTIAKLPRDDVPEVAFVGRSNVGKSSLINALLQRKGLARTSKTPGRTQMINLFSVKILCRTKSHEWVAQSRFVDLPGYGYAAVPEQMKAEWTKRLGDYYNKRDNLRLVLLLSDARREFADEERLVLSRQGPLFCVFTKCDKLTRSELAARRRSGATLNRPTFFVSTSPKLSGDFPELSRQIFTTLPG